MTSELFNNLNGNIQEYRQPDLTFKVYDDNVEGKIDKLESVKQSIKHILSTERYSNPIYPDSYGIELQQYIGQDYGMLVAGIEGTLIEALTQDDRVKNVIVSSIKKNEIDSVKIEFVVYTIYGNYTEEINVIQ